MPKTIFFDVGGHIGQTLEEVLLPEYSFDRIECFEPHPESVAIIRRKFAEAIRENKLRVHNFGLWNKDDSLNLFGDNADAGSSVFEDKSVTGEAQSHAVQLRDVCAVVEETTDADDVLIMKLNCEGAEGPILRRLTQTGLIQRFAIIMVDFDLYKVPGKMREPKAIERAIKQAKYNGLMKAEEVMVGATHQMRIRNWLAHVSQHIDIGADADFFAELPKKQSLKRSMQKRVQRTLKRLTNGRF